MLLEDAGEAILAEASRFPGTCSLAFSVGSRASSSPSFYGNRVDSETFEEKAVAAESGGRREEGGFSPSDPEWGPRKMVLADGRAVVLAGRENSGDVAIESIRMSESKAVIGLSWEPKLSLLSSAPKNGSDKSENVAENSGASLWKPDSELVDGLFVPPNNPRKVNKLLRKQVKDTTGTKWFDMPAPTITPELKKDLQLLKLRSAIDPKRHYKKSDSKSKTLPKYFQVGTVIESASDFFSGRLTKKERKASLADELLSNSSFADYRKRKVREIEEQNRPAGVDKWKIKGRQSWKRKKQRRH
uniref:Fcf2 pre-rRNA processing C-terminal domain-containing protein n=1 Tax=Vitis vinifera TaxID=29760 RepID=F6HE40_VITVI